MAVAQTQKVLLIWENRTCLEFVFTQFEEHLHGEDYRAVSTPSC